MLQFFRRLRNGIGRPRETQGSSGLFRERYGWFKELLASNTELLALISGLEGKLSGQELFGMSSLRTTTTRAVFHAFRMINCLDLLTKRKDSELWGACETLRQTISRAMGRQRETKAPSFVLPLAKAGRASLDWVGGKSAGLGEIVGKVGLPAPEGFVITTLAFETFLDHHDLRGEIQKRQMEIRPEDPLSLQQGTEEIQRAILSTEIPDALASAILQAWDSLSESCQAIEKAGVPLRVALRSSALGEDSDLSYAGQYVSSFNIPRDQILQTYRYIVASLYTPRAVAYRLNKGIPDEDTAMAVLCLEMVDSLASGVLYTRHPLRFWENEIVVSAVWGLGLYAVEGVLTPDTYRVRKDGGFSVLERSISSKAVQLVMNPNGGLVERPVPEGMREAPCLDEDHLRTLCAYALCLEGHFGGPQDIEWAMDRQGRILLLQSRPLVSMAGPEDGTRGPLPPVAGYRILLEGGSPAFPGAGAGRAFPVLGDEDLLRFPEGGVLLARHSSPKFMTAMPRARAIVTEAGSVTGHMASLAREFKVPCLLGVKEATTRIPAGLEITVDAFSGRVYEGEVKELLDLGPPPRPVMKGTPLFTILEKVAHWIVPLHLVDPRSPEFSPKNCRSLHDIARYVHERSYKAMFEISDLVSHGRVDGMGAVKLVAPIPLDLHVIDLDGGLRPRDPHVPRVQIEDVLSVPFRALLRGMLHERLRARGPRPVHLKGLFSVMTEQLLSPPADAGERFGDRSYAIVSDTYLNFSSRVGYHYSVLDAYCGDTLNKNYITFSFKGGAADDLRRARRAKAIASILSSLGFEVEVQGDRVDARYQKYERPLIEDRLDRVGRLLQFTRQMDMLMEDEASVQAVAQAFLNEDYDLENIPRGKA